MKAALLMVAAIVVAAPASAVIVDDPSGDFPASDVVSLAVDVNGPTVVFTVTYANEVIGMTSGVGGIIGLDTDRDPTTGASQTRGFEAQIIYNVSGLAATAQIVCWSGFEEGATTQIGSDFGNGTHLSHADRRVTVAVPLKLIESDGNFDLVLFATPQFAVGEEWDRVPDRGSVNARTGQSQGIEIAGNAGPHTLQANPAPGQKPLIKSVTTSLEGENAVWTIESAKALPTDAMDFGNVMTYTLLIDVDRKLATGVDTGGVPFLPFGPERKVQCVLSPGGHGSIDIITGIRFGGEREHAGGGAGSSDLQLTFDRRTARLVIPLWLIGAKSTKLDWMLSAARTTGKAEVDCFRNTAIQFDTGKDVKPLSVPAHALMVSDPVDARIEVQGPGAANAPPMPITHLPNIELTGLKTALTPEYLLAEISYLNPITPQPHYLTAVDVDFVDPVGITRKFRLSINWDPVLGGQAILGELTSDITVTNQKVLNQCLSAEKNKAFVLVPVAAFDQKQFKTAQLAVITGQFVRSFAPLDKTDNKGEKVPGGVPTVRYTDCLDRIPNAGAIILSAQ